MHFVEMRAALGPLFIVKHNTFEPSNGPLALRAPWAPGVHKWPQMALQMTLQMMRFTQQDLHHEVYTTKFETLILHHECYTTKFTPQNLHRNLHDNIYAKFTPGNAHHKTYTTNVAPRNLHHNIYTTKFTPPHLRHAPILYLEKYEY